MTPLPAPIRRSLTFLPTEPEKPGGLPPARDPRMDRPEAAPDEAVWTVLVVPRTGGVIREYVLTQTHLRRLRRGLLAAGALGVVLLLAIGVTLPRAVAYPALVDENMALKLHLQSVDQRMGDVDRLLLRLRLYDAQLRSLDPPDGDAGGPERVFVPPDAGPDAVAALDEVPLDDTDAPSSPLGGASALFAWAGVGDDAGTRDAGAWAVGLEHRAARFLSLFARAEPDIAAMMEDLEDLHALETALPRVWPAEGLMSSGYGWRRDPFRRRWKFHSGLDVAGPRGTPIYAAGAGTVLRAEWHSGYGRMIEIDHGFGVTTLYGHCHRLYARPGQRVEPGAFIATMGSTGRSTGPHLHFEVRLDGAPVDPLDYLPSPTDPDR